MVDLQEINMPEQFDNGYNVAYKIHGRGERKCCKAEGCRNYKHTAGYCYTHYKRELKAGNITLKVRQYKPTDGIPWPATNGFPVEL